GLLAARLSPLGRLSLPDTRHQGLERNVISPAIRIGADQQLYARPGRARLPALPVAFQAGLGVMDADLAQPSVGRDAQPHQVSDGAAIVVRGESVLNLPASPFGAVACWRWGRRDHSLFP